MRRTVRLAHILLLTLLPWVALSARGREYSPEDVPNVQLQDRTRLVSDPEQYFGADDRHMLDERLLALRDKYGVEAVLVVVPAIKGDDDLGFSVRLFESWGIGKEEEDNGLLILYVTEQPGRLVRFEVGYGLEGILTDARTSALTRQVIVPAILDGNAAAGFGQALDRIDDYLSAEYDGGGSAEPTDGAGGVILLVWWLGISLLVGLLQSLSLVRFVRKEKDGRKRLEKSMDLKHGTPAGTFLHTILFPMLFVYAPTASWAGRRLLTDKCRCPNCGGQRTVHTLSYPKNQSLLTAPQQVEAGLGSRYFHALECEQCGYTDIVSRDNYSSVFTTCPHCHTKAYGPETGQAGRLTIAGDYVLEHYRCRYCGHTGTKRHRRRRDNRPIIIGGGIGGGMGGGFGGGSFGGGFGGGRSGGGGSTVRF